MKQGVREHGTNSKKRIKIELTQLHNMETVQPVQSHEIKQEQRK